MKEHEILNELQEDFEESIEWWHYFDVSEALSNIERPKGYNEPIVVRSDPRIEAVTIYLFFSFFALTIR